MVPSAPSIRSRRRVSGPRVGLGDLDADELADLVDDRKDHRTAGPFELPRAGPAFGEWLPRRLVLKTVLLGHDGDEASSFAEWPQRSR
jgi:hypothetical protein